MAAVKPIGGKRQKQPLATTTRKPESPLDKAKGYEVNWSQVSDLFNEVRLIKGARFVYVIGERPDGPVKIGIAKDPIARVRGMQTGNPRRLRVEFVLLGDNYTEKLLHEFWEPFVIRAAARRVDAPPGTEWFRGEVRERLFPIIETAAAKQVAFLRDHFKTYTGQSVPDITPVQTESLIRDAHKEHGFVAKGRDQVHLLGSVAGTVVHRRSRI